MRRLLRPILIVLAVVFLVEAWLWRHLEPIVEWIVERLPFRRLKAWCRAMIARLSPMAVLPVFIIPVLALLPFKVFGLWLLARGAWVGASVTLVMAKFASMGVTAFIIDVTLPKLLQLAWFRWLYEHVIIWLKWAHGLVDPLKARIKVWLRVFGPRHARRAFRLLRRIRARMRAERRAAAPPVRTDAPRAAPTAQSP
jgi:hypothetical protein